MGARSTVAPEKLDIAKLTWLAALTIAQAITIPPGISVDGDTFTTLPIAAPVNGVVRNKVLPLTNGRGSVA